MNLILLNREDLVDGVARLSSRVNDHINHTLRSKHGDIVRVGVIAGQKGLGQLAPVKEASDAKKKNCEWTVQLLPLSFRTIHDALAAQALPSNEDGNENEENPRNSRNDASRGQAERLPSTTNGDCSTEARYMFPKLTHPELDVWLRHPYHKHAGVGEDSKGTDGYVKSDLTCQHEECACASVWREGTWPGHPMAPSPPVYQSTPFIDVVTALPRPKVFDRMLQVSCTSNLKRYMIPFFPQHLAAMSIGRINVFAATR